MKNTIILTTPHGNLYVDPDAVIAVGWPLTVERRGGEVGKPTRMVWLEHGVSFEVDDTPSNLGALNVLGGQ